jgi:uncharacterized membrane protein HdeD (DUF308 family)
MPTITGFMNTDTATAPLGYRWGWLLALGIVEIIAGGIAIAAPLIASLAVVAVFGAVLIVTAILQLAHAFRVRSWSHSAWYGLGGVLYALAGILVVAYPLGGALTLTVLIAILFIVDGTLRTAFGVTARPAMGWGWLVAGGIGSIMVGVILLLGWPASALWATGVLLGINLIFSGVTHGFLALESPARQAA